MSGVSHFAPMCESVGDCQCIPWDILEQFLKNWEPNLLGINWFCAYTAYGMLSCGLSPHRNTYFQMLSKYQVGQLGIVLTESELLRSPARTSCAPPLWTPGTLARRPENVRRVYTQRWHSHSSNWTLSSWFSFHNMNVNKHFYKVFNLRLAPGPNIKW